MHSYLKPTRRHLLSAAGACLFTTVLEAAPPFWERKAASQWSSDEIAQLLNRSPWARETNLDFEATEGGRLEMPQAGAPPRPGEYVPPVDPAKGSLQRSAVVVRWESAQPVRDALQIPSIKSFEGRYVVGVSNIPPTVMTRRRRGAPDSVPTPEDLLAELQGAATLESPGREPVGAGLVKHVAGSENNYLFGFDRDLLPLTGREKEVLFVLRTARVSVKAKFEPKNMFYRGKFAV
jgi:hypothetical protein